MGGVNQMWILENSKDLLEYIQSSSFSSCNSIKTFDFSVLYTAIPHSKLKDRIRELVQLWSIEKNGQCRCKYLVLGRDKSETDIINILEFLIDNTIVMFGGRVLKQAVGIPMSTHCAPLLANLFLYLHEAGDSQEKPKEASLIL